MMARKRSDPYPVSSGSAGHRVLLDQESRAVTPVPLLCDSTVGPSLVILGNDILHQICAIVSTIDREGSSTDEFNKVELTSLLALSQTSRTLRELSMPFLFKVSVIKDIYPAQGWMRFSTKLKQLSEEPSVPKHIKTFTFILTLPKVGAGSSVLDTSEPPSELPPLLAQIFLRLPKLQSLHLDLRQYHIDPWISAIQSTNLVLPGVQSLVLDHLCVFMVPFCPNVSTIRITVPWAATVDWKETLKTALTAEKLTSLQITDRWSIEMVDVLRSIPNKIKTLGTVLPGDASINDIIQRLAGLPSLESLTLAYPSNLNVGFTPPRCGNSYMGPNGAAARKRVGEQRKRAENKVVKMVDAAFGANTKLKNLHFHRDRLAVFVKIPESDGVMEEVVEKVGNWGRLKAK